MTEPLPISKARDVLTSLPERLARERRALAVTRRGEPVLAILPWELYDGLIETLEVLSDQELMQDLRESIRELKAGRMIPWTEVRKEIEALEGPHDL